MPARPALRRRLRALALHLHAGLTRPEGLAFVPALTLGAFWLGGEGALLVVALGVPAVLAIAGWPRTTARARPDPREAADPATGLPRRGVLERQLDAQLKQARGGSAGAPACIVLSLVEGDALARHLGHAAFAALLGATARNLAAALRPQDMVARLDGACFAIALAPFPRPDLESLLQVAARLQSAAEVEFCHAAARMTPQTCLGAALVPPNRPSPPDAQPGSPGGRGIPRPLPADPPDPYAAWTPDTGRELLEAAEIAMDNARAAGPGAIRVHDARMLRDRADQIALRADLAAAVERNELIAHFQPQLCARSGAVTGFEALVRWRHPRRGLLAPAAFLDALVASGLAAQLGDLMLGHALAALREWDHAGLKVPSIAVNLSAAELRQPGLADRIAWELDRHAIAPGRLVIEVLETVIARPDDAALLSGVDRLRRIGCRIDLDDFGTGNASFGAIRRLGAHRLKIDRSFVSGAHADPARADMIAAIVAVARKLGLDTVAEGIEDEADRLLAARFGCGHVQGYGIARPMPLEATHAWLAHHAACNATGHRSDTG